MNPYEHGAVQGPFHLQKTSESLAKGELQKQRSCDEQKVDKQKQKQYISLGSKGVVTGNGPSRLSRILAWG